VESTSAHNLVVQAHSSHSLVGSAPRTSNTPHLPSLNVAPPLLRSARTCPSHRLPIGGGACECECARGGVGAAQILVDAVRYHGVSREIAHVLPEDENRHPVEPAAEGYQALESVTTMAFGPTGFKRTRSYFGPSARRPPPGLKPSGSAFRPTKIRSRKSRGF
jgi:hypothetical protein